MSSTVPLWVVEIECKRVQSYLFAVPKLREIIGANTLLGETLRIELTRCAIKHEAGLGSAVSLPASLVPSDPNDPLHQKYSDANSPFPLHDDPAELFKRGILARDGGHFRALFPDETKAQAFSQAAELLLLEQLAGLRYEITLKEITLKKAVKDNDPQPLPLRAIALPTLPILQNCQRSGNEPASVLLKALDEEGSTYPVAVSQAVAQQRGAGDRFMRGQSTQDMVGLLREQLYPKNHYITQPRHFEELAGEDYLAVIHADGNGIGKRFSGYLRRHESQNYLEREAQAEAFFHRMRVVVRQALIKAVKQTFHRSQHEYKVWPFQVLMQGGDDLLLVCQARYALDFVVSYAEQLEQSGRELRDGKSLSIGVGIAIAKHTYPFHHLHHLAEALASSAKVLQRAIEAKTGEEVSTVDWFYNTQSWSSDPLAVRQKVSTYCLNNKQAILSLKPYRILGEFASLKQLLAREKQLPLVRSQLRDLVIQMEKGVDWSELVYDELRYSPAYRDQGEAMTQIIGSQLWRQQGSYYISELPDLVECMELLRPLSKSGQEDLG